jgi:putative Holliday junction resolvase
MKLASIDIGLKRIGVAISFDGVTVLPQNAIIRRNRKQASHDIRVFLEEWGIERLIVGLPKDGSSSQEMQRRIEHFVSLIKPTMEVIYQDEQGSSFEAGELIKGEIKHKRDGRLDSLAAKIILERYLQSTTHLS